VFIGRPFRIVAEQALVNAFKPLGFVVFGKSCRCKCLPFPVTGGWQVALQAVSGPG
jgi:hypothetical protein